MSAIECDMLFFQKLWLTVSGGDFLSGKIGDSYNGNQIEYNNLEIPNVTWRDISPLRPKKYNERLIISHRFPSAISCDNFLLRPTFTAMRINNLTT